MTPEIHDGPDKSISASHSNVNRVDISERTLSILAIVLGVASFVTALWSIHESDFTRRHVEELRIRIENAENTLIISGVTKPRDAELGPENNPDRLKRK